MGRAQRIYTTPYSFSTYAGSATNGSGSVDGPLDLARFNVIHGVAVDGAGNIYVADSGNDTIRKISSGVVTTLAGKTRVSGSSDGSGTDAQFSVPYGVAVDLAGNIYVADYDNHVIRKITPTGFVSTFAGTPGSYGATDGVGSAARFNSPDGIAVDSVGNVYVSDNATIRKITSSGVVATLAGSPGLDGSTDGVGSVARFSAPAGLAVDNAGNIYVADRNNSLVRKVTSDGVVTTLAGLAQTPGSADGTGKAARFNRPSGVAVDGAGNVYVADNGQRTIRKITPAGAVSTLAGNPSDPNGNVDSIDGIGSAASFANPFSIAIDGAGNLVVGDGITLRIVSSNGQVTTIAGAPFSPGSNDGSNAFARFKNPSGVALDAAGNLYVADTGNQTIRKIANGSVTTLAGLAHASGVADGIGSAARFNNPYGVATDSSGNVYVADRDNHIIRKITSGGLVTTLAGSAGNAGSADGTGNSARFKNPMGVAVDGAGNIYVADAANSTIRKITASGNVTTIAGAAGIIGITDGVGVAARFISPTGVVVDASNNLFVSDASANTIRKITKNGIVTTLAGFGNVDDGRYHPSPYFPPGQGWNDGMGTTALFYTPIALALDGTGNLYVADLLNNSIRRVTPTGLVTSVAGSEGTADGIGSGVGFNRPSGIASDPFGNVYVTDSFNNSIRLGVPAPNGRLINLSARTTAGTADATLLVGVVVGGAETSGTAPVLIRGAGPTLSSYGIATALADPRLEFALQGAGTPIATNDDWKGDPQVMSVGNSVGAFPFVSATSKDAALFVSPPSGVYSVTLSGAKASTGIALAEIYDASGGTYRATTPRLVNLSARTQVGTGENVLIAGFVVQGPSPVTVLIRAVGPTLASYGVNGALADPQLQLTNNVEGTDYVIANNDNWGGNSQVATFADYAGAFTLGAESKDAAILMTLAPGVYSAKVSGVGGTTGVALVEIYEVR